MREQLYSPYERIWHWLQAAVIVLLIVTGASVHAPDMLIAVPFALAVRIHNVLGFLLLANAFLGAFYYFTTGVIRQYIPEPRDFVSLAVRQAIYYVRGIFRGAPHPLERTPQRRFNPLQQVTYLIILNVLLPLQMATGALMWGGQYWPRSVQFIGGLPVLGMVHTLGAWLFGSFAIMHVYLTTTGPTPLSHLKAMLTGYEDLPHGAGAPSGDGMPNRECQREGVRS